MKAILSAIAVAMLATIALAQTAPLGGTANFRPLVDPSIKVADVAIDDQGAITVFTKTNAYRWNYGALTDLFPDAPLSLSLTGGTQIFRGTAFGNGSVDLIIGDFSVGTTAVARKTADSFTIISNNGDQSGGPVPFTINYFSGIVRTKGKTAFWAQENFSNSNRTIELLDGTALNEWFTTLSPLWWENFDTAVPQTGEPWIGRWFDGDAAAFVAWSSTGEIPDGIVFSLNSSGELNIIARTGDPIPGTSRKLSQIRPDGIVTRGGKILFLNAADYDRPSDLLEYDGSQADKLRRIVSVGDVVGAGKIATLGRRFDYLSDGSIIFEAGGKDSFGFPTTAILRWRDGILTTDIDDNRQFNGSRLGELELVAVGGTNYVFIANRQYFTTADVVDAPIQLEKSDNDRQWGITTIQPLTGEPVEVSPRLIHGSNAKFQWYEETGSGPNRAFVAMSGQTNQTLNLGPAIRTLFGIHMLVATNSISSDSRTFHINVFEPSRPYTGFPNWEDLEGEHYKFDFQQLSESPALWFKDGAPIAPPPLEGVLSSENVGTYWFTTTNNWTDFKFTSPKMTLRIAPVTDTQGKFRRVGFDDGVMRADGSVTYANSTGIYRWHKGVTQKLFDAPATPPRLEHFSTLTIHALSADNSFCDLALGSSTNWGYHEIYRLDTNGLRAIAKPGIEINTDPPMVANQLRGLGHGDGKTAFWASSVTNNRTTVTALKVYDGTEIREWFNTRNLPAGFSDYELWMSTETFRPFGFDGTNVAIVGGDRYGRTALFVATAEGDVRCIAKFGDLIPGTTNRLGRISQQTILVDHGRILFSGATTDDFQDRCVLVYDPSQEPALRLIAKEGDFVGGRPIHIIVPVFPFAFASDGSVLFTASLGFYNLELPWSLDYTTELDMAVIRWRDGNLNAEITSRQRIGGQQNRFVVFKSAAGTNYCFSAQSSLYTTAEGGPPPADTTLKTTPTSNGFNATWSEGGILQYSPDLLRWDTLLYEPGAVTNDVARAARYFRVHYP